MKKLLLLCCAAALAAGAARTGRGKMTITVTSPAFRSGEYIPAKHACGGADVSPELNWKGLPPGTRSVAVIMDDPDAPPGTWVHWVVFDVPPELGGLPENLPKGETLPVSIGQGYVLTTPIQLASMIATVANEGTVYRPHLVKKVVDRDGKTIKEFAPEVLRRTRFNAEQFRLVKEGLLAVVNEPRGTGAGARLYEVKVAGKTGTSQVVKMRDSKGDVPYQYRDHALFVAFAPYDKPEVAVAVVVEHGEHGGGTAAPVAGSVLRHYFESKGVIKKPGRGASVEVDDADGDQPTEESQGEQP